MKNYTKLFIVAITATIFILSAPDLKAQLQNIPCTGYNADVVASGTGLASNSTDKDIDGAGYVFIDNTFRPTTSCSTYSTNIWATSVSSAITSGLTYTLMGATSSNSLRITGGNSADLTVTTPVSVDNLYVLATGGNGTCTFSATVTFTDNATQTFTGKTAPDWCTGSSPATGKFYRNLRTSNSCSNTGLCPYMYEINLAISTANKYRKISTISFSNGIGTGILHVFAIGGNAVTPPACTTPPAQPTALTLTPNSTVVTGSFTAASGADSYLIIRSTATSLSDSPVTGTNYVAGSSFGGGIVVGFQPSTTFTDDGLTEGTIYYYYIFAASSNCIGGPMYLTTNPLSDASTTTASGIATYTASDIWTCPLGVTSIKVECWGGGGGGGFGRVGATGGGGGGGGGAYTKNTAVTVVPGTQYAITVGAYGTAGLSGSPDGGDGANSSFESTVVANGGKGGKSYANSSTGGAGGTAGTFAGGKGATGTSSQSGGGAGGAGSSAIGKDASGITAGAATTSNGGTGGAGSTGDYVAGSNGSSYGGGGAGGTRDANGGCGAKGLVVITCPCTTFNPTFSAAPAANSCIGTTVTYSTQMGQSNYSWSVPGTAGTNYTIISGGIGTTNNTVTLKWLTAGSKTVTVNYSASGCPGASAASSTTTVNALPVPTFTASPTTTLCANSSATYTTQAGQYNYTWSVPGTLGTDYSISAGGIGTSSNTVTLIWLTAGSKVVTVNYSNVAGCFGASAASSTTTVSLATPTFSSLPTTPYCTGSSYTYTTQASQSNYTWSVSGTSGTDYTITSGGIGSSSNTVTLKWLTAGSKTVSVNYTNASGCTGASPAISTITVGNVPTITNVISSTFCGNNKTVTLGASASNGTVNWYTVSTGGTATATGESFTTPSINATNSYYVDATNSYGCTTSSRTTVTATKNPAIATVSGVSSASICGTGTAILTATASTGSLKWYNVASSGIALDTGTTFTTPIISATTIYYVEAFNCNGTSSRTAVTATVKALPIPSFTTSPTDSMCVGSTATYTTQTGQSNYTWSVPGTLGIDYTISSGGIGTSSSTVTIIWLTVGNKTVTVNYSNASGCTGVSAASFTTTVNAIPTVIIADGNTCKGGSVTFGPISSGSTFDWYQTASSSTVLGTLATYTTPILSATTNYYVTASANGCTSARFKITAVVYPDTTRWNGTNDTNWDNSANWSNGIPGFCSNVIIGGSVTYLPDISATTKTISTVNFEPEASIFGVKNLTYTKAFVQMTLKRDQWYTLTTPLKNMYSGDYYFNGAPITYMRLFDAINPDSASTGTKYTGTWTKSFSSLLAPLTAGSGYAFMISKYEWNYPLGRSSVTTDKTITFPRLNADNTLVTTLIPYDGLNGRLNPVLAKTLPKNASTAFRFAMEDASNTLQNVSINLTSGLNLIGNPLMSHLDFAKLYASNSGVITNKVKFWNGTTFTTFMTGCQLSSSTTSDGTIIPPMQSFFVSSPSGGTMTIDLANHFTTNNSSKLRAASTNSNTLHISTDNGSLQSSTCVALRDGTSNDFGDDDAFKLFSQLKHVPEVYTLAGDIALDINQFETLPYTVPLCLKTDSGNVSFTFSGAESFDDNIIVELINATTNETQDLRENNSYALKANDTNGEGTLYLSFREASISTENAMISRNHDIEIFAMGENTIRIVSLPNDLIKEVQIWNTTGKTVQHCCVLKKSQFDITVKDKNQLYFVQVVTENNSRMAKILVK